MKRMWLVCGLLAAVAGTARGQAAESDANVLKPLPADPAIAHAIAGIDPAKIKADIAKLVSFGTRNTLSSMETDLPAGQGINAAADWVESEFKAISATCGGCLEVKRDEFIEPAAPAPAGRVPRPTRLVNVYAIFHGSNPSKAAPWVLVTGHYDSRATDVMDPKVGAPGANDDASGVAVSLESARALTSLHLPGTIVFVAVAGEEQGLLGAHHLAKFAREQGWPLVGVLNNDIVGGDTTPGDTMADKNVVRLFSESVPSSATPDQAKAMLGLGAENDSPSRELARSIVELAPAYFEPTPGKRPPSTPGRPHSMMIMAGQPASTPCSSCAATATSAPAITPPSIARASPPSALPSGAKTSTISTRPCARKPASSTATCSITSTSLTLPRSPASTPPCSPPWPRRPANPKRCACSPARSITSASSSGRPPPMLPQAPPTR